MIICQRFNLRCRVGRNSRAVTKPANTQEKDLLPALKTSTKLLKITDRTPERIFFTSNKLSTIFILLINNYLLHGLENQFLTERGKNKHYLKCFQLGNTDTSD